MEGLESFCALILRTAAFEGDDDEVNYGYDASGRRYVSAMPQRERARGR